MIGDARELPEGWVWARWLDFAYEATRGQGSGNNQPALNKSRVEAMRFLLAPLAEQHALVARVEALLAGVEALATQARESREALDALTQSTLARAFRGELVPQDPADEPAAVLLARLRAERAGTSGERPRRGRPAKAPRGG